MRKQFIPYGRLPELISRPDANLIAVTYGANWKAEVVWMIYPSRKALEAFCRDGSKHHALFKTPVARNLLTNKNIQRAI